MAQIIVAARMCLALLMFTSLATKRRALRTLDDFEADPSFKGWAAQKRKALRRASPTEVSK